MDDLITSIMPLLITLAFARRKKEVRQTASLSTLCMGRGHLIQSSARLDGGSRTTIGLNSPSYPPRQFKCTSNRTTKLDNYNQIATTAMRQTANRHHRSGCGQQAADGGPWTKGCKFPMVDSTYQQFKKIKYTKIYKILI